MKPAQETVDNFLTDFLETVKMHADAGLIPQKDLIKIRGLLNG